jgi:prepilin-type N-terminal cleavage/methylation domain-containing protein
MERNQTEQLNIRARSGFTLIELIVSVTIISLVTGIFLANYKSTNRRTDLTMTAQKMVADIRTAQNYALGLARYGASGSTNVPLGGWGLHIDLTAPNGNKQYMIFADDDGDKAYSGPEESVTENGAEIISLPPNIVIDSLSVGNKMDVTFLPPDPITTISGLLQGYPQADIVLRDTNDNSIKTIRINFLGLAEVVN